MYELIVAVLVVLGLLASTFYVFTWGYGALKAAYYRRTILSRVDVVDFGALPFAAWLILLINGVNILVGGINIPDTPGLAFQRVTTLALVVGIVLLRVTRWSRDWRNAPKDVPSDGAPLVDDDVESAS